MVTRLGENYYNMQLLVRQTTTAETKTGDDSYIVKSICVTIITYDPKRIQLGNCLRTARFKCGGFRLRVFTQITI